MTAENKTPIELASMMCDSTINTYMVEELPLFIGRFNYIQGILMFGMQRAYSVCKNAKYYNYIKAWLDYVIDENGNIKIQEEWLDDMMPALVLFDIYKTTGDTRYKKALDTTIDRLRNWKRNQYGGFDHCFKMRNQMWLDGLFMASPLIARYAKEFGDTVLFDEAYRQASLMRDNIKNPKTGLYFHAWDVSCEAPWADKETGLASEAWGRAQGWVAVALCEIIESMPETYEKRAELIDMLADLLKALSRYQDEKTGMWYQVIDKGELSDNWVETSATSLFAYAFHKAVRLGFVESSYSSVAERAYQGLMSKTRIEDGELIISDICIGTMVGDYQSYITRPVQDNDNHGTGAFLLMCAEFATE